MKALFFLSLALALAVLIGSGQGATPVNGVPRSGFDDQDVADTMARVLKENVCLEARADFWLKVAHAFNDYDAYFWDSVVEAWVELQDELADAQEQYLTRLQVWDALGSGLYNPEIDPADFSTTVDNPYMPFVPGRTLVYEAQRTEGLERIEVSVLPDTVVIEGVECIAVQEYETLDGVLKEISVNWIAQHVSGDVWYFGEVSREYVDGFLDDLGGSWRAGKDGGKAGILMLAAPTPGQVYRQEYLMNVAEDAAEVVAKNSTVTIPYGTYHNCVKTEEISPLEPEDDVQKAYAPGVGLVVEVDLTTGDRLELVEIIN